jgi:peptidyl-prolyl cis-trans isomerase A (cyclophilin A)
MHWNSRAIICATALVFLGALPAPAQMPAPRATIETSMGNIVVELDAEHTPMTVANFVRYAREGHFNGTIIYRVVP